MAQDDDANGKIDPPWCPAKVGFEMTKEEFEGILKYISDNLFTLFEIQAVRTSVARGILESLEPGEIRRIDETPKEAVRNTVSYNIETMRTGEALERPDLLINPLSSIDMVRLKAPYMKVLSVGPRSEAEIYALLSAGFSPRNIRGLDLFSYSDYVDVGDMHDMPYPDDTFDVIILGWVLAYSRDNAKVAAEVMRVAKPHALVAAGCVYLPYDNDTLREYDEDRYLDPTRFDTADDILGLFGDSVQRVVFRHDIHPAMRAHQGDIMTIFQLTG